MTNLEVKRILKSMCKKSLLGEESMGENMWVKKICKKNKYLGEESLGAKYVQEEFLGEESG